ncbi:MAG: hypothetical protein SGPRY_003875 [Prymnesium sp.]
MGYGVRHPWAEAHRLLRCVLVGTTQPELLHAHLSAHVDSALSSLPPSPRSASELALVADPAFHHFGHALEPDGRRLLVELSEQLGLSELACWEMLFHEASRCHARSPAPKRSEHEHETRPYNYPRTRTRTSPIPRFNLNEVALSPPNLHLELADLKAAVASTFYKERHAMLLLSLDCLKLLSDPSFHTSAARPTAEAFLRKLGSVGQSRLPLLSAQGQADGPEVVAVRLLHTIERMVPQQKGVGADAGSPRAQAPELELATHCLFYVCKGAPLPPQLSAAAVLAICDQFLKYAAELGPCLTTDVFFMTLLVLLMPPEGEGEEERAFQGRPVTASASQRQLREKIASWRTSALNSIQPSFAEAASLALDLACSLSHSSSLLPISQEGSAGGGEGPALPPCFQKHADVAFTFLSDLCARRGVDPAFSSHKAEAEPLLSPLYPLFTQLHVHQSEIRDLFPPTPTSPLAFEALLRWVAALHHALPHRCEQFWEDEVLVAFAYDTGCRLGAQPSLYVAYISMLVSLSSGGCAEHCDALLHRPSMQQLSPALTLMIPDYVSEQLATIHEYQQRSLLSQADDVLRDMVDRFALWEAALSLFTHLTSQSQAFAAEWVEEATSQLVRLQYLGVGPQLKAAALSALAAFATAPFQASRIWGELMPPADKDGRQPTGGEPSDRMELLGGLKDDLMVEQRHKLYPETTAFMRLLRRLLSSWMGAGVTPPSGVGRFVQWIAEDLFCHLHSFEFREQAGLWTMASGCLSVFLELLYGSEPVEGSSHSSPPTTPPELPINFQLLCAFVKPHSPLFRQLLWLLSYASAAVERAKERCAALRHMIGLATNFLNALLLREGAVYSTLQSLRQQVCSGRALLQEDEAVAAMHLDLWHSLPQPGVPTTTLAHMLSHAIKPGYVHSGGGGVGGGGGAPSRSTLAAILLLIKSCTEGHCASSLVGCALAVLRRALPALETGWFKLLRTEGGELEAKEAFILLLAQAGGVGWGFPHAGREGGVVSADLDAPALMLYEFHSTRAVGLSAVDDSLADEIYHPAYRKLA